MLLLEESEEKGSDLTFLRKGLLLFLANSHAPFMKARVLLF